MRTIMFSVVLMLLCFTVPAKAVAEDAQRHLFVHISSDEPHRVHKALGFAANQMDRGTMVTVYADDKAVRMLQVKDTDKPRKEEQLVARLVAGGASVIICPFSMKHYGVSPESLLPGVKQGSLDMVEPLLFAPNIRVLDW